MSQQTAPCTREGFEVFFRESYRELVKTAVTAGATREEAEDSVSEALVPMYKRWPVNGFPLRYARKAVVYNFVKYKTRRGRYLTGRGLAEHDEGAPARYPPPRPVRSARPRANSNPDRVTQGEPTPAGEPGETVH